MCTGAAPLHALVMAIQAALRAKEAGSTRFCMGAAWRGPSQVGPRQWERVLEMVRRIRGLGMEVRRCMATRLGSCKQPLSCRNLL